MSCWFYIEVEFRNKFPWVIVSRNWCAKQPQIDSTVSLTPDTPSLMVIWRWLQQAPKLLCKVVVNIQVVAVAVCDRQTKSLDQLMFVWFFIQPCWLSSFKVQWGLLKWNPYKTSWRRVKLHVAALSCFGTDDGANTTRQFRFCAVLWASIKLTMFEGAAFLCVACVMKNV